MASVDLGEETAVPGAKPNHAYGVDPHRPQFYSLREARYDAIADDIDRWAGEAEASGRTLKLIDVGCTTGRLFRHLEPRRHCDAIAISGADIVSHPIYRRERYEAFWLDDLRLGNPHTPSDAFDVVVCEQVLEHLPSVGPAIAGLERIARPGGKVVIGVPIFIPPFAFARDVWVQASLRWRPHKRWSHVQTFSQGSFLRQVRRHSRLRLLTIRGFRVVSGGLLRPLEDLRWWWRLNRRIGAAIPWACVEIQAIFEKPLA